MDTRDREAIESLFTKIGDVERQAGTRDGEAERLIAERLQRQPAAPYYMAQTIVMQDMAIESQQRRIEELERAAKAAAATPPAPQQSEGGFLSRVLGTSGAGRASAPPADAPRASGPWGAAPAAAPAPDTRGYGQAGVGPAPAPPGGYAQPGYAQGGYPQGGYAPPPQAQGFGRGMGGGGFLAGAAQTAMGVAGGVMLGSALTNMFEGHGGLFGGGSGGTPEVQETVTNIFEAPQGDTREIADTGGDASADDSGGSQDVSYDDGDSYDPGSNDDGSYDV